MTTYPTDSAVLRWQAPPSASDRTRVPDIDHETAACQLAAQPGTWGVLAVCDPHLHQELACAARRIQNGSPRFYRPSRTFEARAVYHDGQSHLYVRAIGPAR